MLVERRRSLQPFCCSTLRGATPLWLARPFAAALRRTTLSQCRPRGRAAARARLTCASPTSSRWHLLNSTQGQELTLHDKAHPQ